MREGVFYAFYWLCRPKLTAIAESIRFMDALDAVSDSNELEALRVRFLGKKGELTAVLKTMGTLSAEERPVFGQAANSVREAIEQKLEQARQELKAKALDAKLRAEAIDITIPGTPVELGHRHPMGLISLTRPVNTAMIV